MNKAELIDALGQRAGLTRKQAEDAVVAFQDIVVSTIKNGGEVTITGFGTFLSRSRHARMGVDPRNPTKRIQIPEVRVPKFKAGQALKNALK